MTEETYRREFRQLKRRDSEPFQEVTTRLAHLLQQSTGDCSTADEVWEVIVIEQFLSILLMEMRLWVQERKPPTGEAAGLLADEYAEARVPASGGPPRGADLHCAKYSDTIQRDLREIPGLWPISLTGRG